MANNRMWITNRRTGAKVLLAKYYPSTGWYVSNKDFKERMDLEFTKVDFGSETWPNSSDPKVQTVQYSSGGDLGKNEWVLEYEMEDSTGCH